MLETREITYRLPERVFFEAETGAGEVDLASLAIAGFVDWEEPEKTANYNKWPYPVFLVGGEEAAERREERRSYWRLVGDILTDQPGELSKVTVPDSCLQPWVFIKNGGYPTTCWAYLFDPPLAYSQEIFTAEVSQTEILPGRL